MAQNPIEYAMSVTNPSNIFRQFGTLAIQGGRPVVWAGPNAGWQSPETYYQLVGPSVFKSWTGAGTPAEVYAKAATAPGFDATKNPFAVAAEKKPPEQGTITRSDQDPRERATDADIDRELPETKPPYPTATIPQKEEEGFTRLIDLLERSTSPERIAEIEGMRAENLLRSQLLTSELTRAGERARYARDIEKENIQAWQNIRTAQIQANAAQQAALGLGMISAFAPPNAAALSSTLQAAMQPFSNISFKRG